MQEPGSALRIAVTGAAGSLGRRVVTRLCAQPWVARVLALDRAALSLQDPKLEFQACDVREVDLARRFAGCDAVVHLAFIVERGSRDADETETINVGGSRNVFEAAAAAGVGQVVYASSVAAYGFHTDTDGLMLGEDVPRRGNEEFYYGRHKASVERWLDDFEPRHPEMRIARLRPSIFLAEDSARSVGLLRSPVHFVIAGPDPKLQITHESDVADAFVLALEKGARGAYNVANQEPLGMREMGRAMGKPTLVLPRAVLGLHRLAWKAGLVEVDPVWMDVAGGLSLLVSADKIHRELGWKPRFETTGDVLRQLAARPNALASHAVKAFFGPLRRATRLFGGLPARREMRAETRGLEGSINLVFTGARPSSWHFTLRDGRIGVHEGLSADARATISMRDETFRDVLSGKLATTTAMMTGRVRVRGDGEMSFLVGGLAGSFKNLREARGWKGWPARRFAAWVLREATP